MYCNKASGLGAFPAVKLCVAITSSICRGPLNSSAKQITTKLLVYLKLEYMDVPSIRFKG